MTPLNMPTWLYKPVKIPNLIEIQKEFLAVILDIIEDVESATPNYILVPSNQIQSNSPATSAYLDSLGLLGRWVYTAFVTGNHGVSVPMHVDTVDWQNRCFGLNIPVLNCDNTYTAFFNAIITTPVDAIRPEQQPAFMCDATTAVEIGRVECSQPYWANVSMPHQPIMGHNKSRIVASLRFSPELHDIFSD